MNRNARRNMAAMREGDKSSTAPKASVQDFMCGNSGFFAGLVCQQVSKALAVAEKKENMMAFLSTVAENTDYASMDENQYVDRVMGAMRKNCKKDAAGVDFDKEFRALKANKTKFVGVDANGISLTTPGSQKSHGVLRAKMFAAAKKHGFEVVSQVVKEIFACPKTGCKRAHAIARVTGVQEFVEGQKQGNLYVYDNAAVTLQKEMTLNALTANQIPATEDAELTAEGSSFTFLMFKRIGSDEETAARVSRA